MKKIPVHISAIIIAKNEGNRIAKCIKHLSFCDEVIVADNGSTDDTVSQARKNGARVSLHDNKEFGPLRNEATALAQGDWLLFIDADEVVSQDLANEIINNTKKHDTSSPKVYAIPRKNYYLGVPWPGVEMMDRLFSRSSQVKWHGVVHETPGFTGDHEKLSGLLIHDTHRTISEMVSKTNEWSEYEAKLRFDAGHPQIVPWRFIRVMMTSFWDSYLRKGGYTVGVSGWIESIYQAFSIFITYAKLWELQQKQSSRVKNP